MIYCSSEKTKYILDNTPYMDDVYNTAIDIMACRGITITGIPEIELYDNGDLILYMEYGDPMEAAVYYTEVVFPFGEILHNPLRFCEQRLQQEKWRQANDNNSSRRRFIRGAICA